MTNTPQLPRVGQLTTEYEVHCVLCSESQLLRVLVPSEAAMNFYELGWSHPDPQWGWFCPECTAKLYKL